MALVGLFLSSYRFKKPMSEVIRATFPILIILFVGVLVITYFAPLTDSDPPGLCFMPRH